MENYRRWVHPFPPTVAAATAATVAAMVEVIAEAVGAVGVAIAAARAILIATAMPGNTESGAEAARAPIQSVAVLTLIGI